MTGFFFKFNHSLSLGLEVNVLIIIYSLVFDEPFFQILTIMFMKVQQTYMSSKSWFGFWRVLEIKDLLSLALESISFKSLFRAMKAPDWSLESW